MKAVWVKIREKGVAGVARAIVLRLKLLVLRLITLPVFVIFLLVYVALFPLVRIRIGIFPTERIGHLALNPELYMRRRFIAKGEKNTARQWTFFVAGQPVNHQILKMWQRKLPVVKSVTLHAALRATQTLWKASPFYEPLEMLSNEYFEFHSAPPALSFTDEEIAQGRAQLRRWGIDPNHDWYVCVHVRDERYLNVVYSKAGDWSYHNFRNADIDTLNLAIEEIIARGGFVIRLGQHVEKPFTVKHSHVIDYAAEWRSDFMDVFLTAHCRFFLGTTSGIADMAMIFDRPRLAVNWVPFGNAPWGKSCLFIPKLVERHNGALGQKLSFEEALTLFSDRADAKLWDGRVFNAGGFRYIDNTPDEILQVTCEMLDRLDSKYQPCAEERELQQLYFSLVPDTHWSKSVRTPIGAAFLKQNKKLLMTTNP